MGDSLGISRDGVTAALKVKESYKTHQPLGVPGDQNRILIPEHLLNANLNLQSFEDPLPLAMMAVRDPEAPMAIAAAARLSPLGRKTKLVSGVLSLVGETSKHPQVRACLDLVTDAAFSPDVVAHVRRLASQTVISSRRLAAESSNA